MNNLSSIYFLHGMIREERLPHFCLAASVARSIVFCFVLIQLKKNLSRTKAFNRLEVLHYPYCSKFLTLVCEIKRTNFQSINRIIWPGWHLWTPTSPTLFWNHCSAFRYMDIQTLPLALWRDNSESVIEQRWGGKLNQIKPSFAQNFSFHVTKWKQELPTISN